MVVVGAGVWRGGQGAVTPTVVSRSELLCPPMTTTSVIDLVLAMIRTLFSVVLPVLSVKPRSQYMN